MSGCASVRYKIDSESARIGAGSETAVTDKKSSVRNRRVWRMSTEMPMGGFVESVPAAAAPEDA